MEVVGVEAKTSMADAVVSWPDVDMRSRVLAGNKQLRLVKEERAAAAPGRKRGEARLGLQARENLRRRIDAWWPSHRGYSNVAPFGFLPYEEDSDRGRLG
jgi:hypothetical protein